MAFIDATLGQKCNLEGLPMLRLSEANYIERSKNAEQSVGFS